MDVERGDRRGDTEAGQSDDERAGIRCRRAFQAIEEFRAARCRGSHLRNEPVPAARNRDDESMVAGTLTERLPDGRNALRQVVLLHVHVRPHRA